MKVLKTYEGGVQLVVYEKGDRVRLKQHHRYPEMVGAEGKVSKVIPQSSPIFNEYEIYFGTSYPHPWLTCFKWDLELVEERPKPTEEKPMRRANVTIAPRAITDEDRQVLPRDMRFVSSVVFDFSAEPSDLARAYIAIHLYENELPAIPVTKRVWHLFQPDWLGDEQWQLQLEAFATVPSEPQPRKVEDLAADLFDHLPTDGMLYTVIDGDIILGARHAGRVYRTGEPFPYHQEFNLTGGVYVEATPPAPKFGGPPKKFKLRLRPGWTREQFIAATRKVYDNARAEYQRQLKAEELLAATDAWREDLLDDDARETFVDSVREEKNKTGHLTGYHEMTEQDIEYWTDWIQAYRERKDW